MPKTENISSSFSEQKVNRVSVFCDKVYVTVTALTRQQSGINGITVSSETVKATYGL